MDVANESKLKGSCDCEFRFSGDGELNASNPLIMYKGRREQASMYEVNMLINISSHIKMCQFVHIFLYYIYNKW